MPREVISNNSLKRFLGWGNTSLIGTNSPKCVPSRWGLLPFDLRKPGFANSVVGLEIAEQGSILKGDVRKRGFAEHFYLRSHVPVLFLIHRESTIKTAPRAGKYHFLRCSGLSCGGLLQQTGSHYLRNIYRNFFTGRGQLRNTSILWESLRSKNWQPEATDVPRIAGLTLVRIIYSKELSHKALFELSTMTLQSLLLSFVFFVLFFSVFLFFSTILGARQTEISLFLSGLFFSKKKDWRVRVGNAFEVHSKAPPTYHFLSQRLFSGLPKKGFWKRGFRH